MIVVKLLALIEFVCVLGILYFLYSIYKFLTNNAALVKNGCIVIVIAIVVLMALRML